MSSPKKKIKILLHGEPYHAKVFSEQLNSFSKGIIESEFYDTLTDKISYSNFDLFHLVSSPLPTIKKLAKHKKPVIYHWIGTDVYRFSNDFYLKKALKKILLTNTRVFNLTVNQALQEELKQIGLTSEVLPLVKLNFTEDIPPLPEKFSILTYVPHSRWEFYNGDLVLELAKEFPGINFHLLAVGDIPSKPENVFTYDFIDDVKEFYANANVLLRITTHDGLSKMVLEALSFGRQVLWNEYFPHCHLVKNQKDCIKALTLLKSNPLYNKAGKDYVEVNYHPQKLCDDYLTLCKNILEAK